MSTSPDALRPLLKAFDFKKLFIDRLGWDRHQARPLVISAGAAAYTLEVVAQKRGMVVYVCGPGPEGTIPDALTRREIDKEVTRTAYEHLIIFTDRARTTQVWQWVKRQRGERTVFRQHTYHTDQPGDSLIQKLLAIRFTLDEEEQLTQPEVAGRVRQALDVDRITRRFYDFFKREHTAFLAFIDGISAQGDREWYASVMLNRLMFVYFIQKQGFLAGDRDYLRNRLKLVQQRKGGDQFHTFYRHFLLRLFHEGLGQPPARRQPDLDGLLGKVPYLNGGIFELHELEQANKGIVIPDEAFQRVFDFFDAYQWHLDDRPLCRDNEINPDVLGYIFEKYINQKQMGAYYTKEDITGYIARNTILPFLLDSAAQTCPAAFRPDGPLWRLLRDDPDRYLYAAVRQGVDRPLPDAIAAGLEDVSQRDGWNRLAPVGFALPTETWREHIGRRQRCHDLRQKLRAGAVHAVNDLITYNLDIVQFAEDVLDACDDPELLGAIWQTLQRISVLDPTCGSGAFLFAALQVLDPLYDACLERMQFFLDEGQLLEKCADFREVLARVEKHPSRRYFILKSIVVQNLYGVDIMKEAVEICKLRLFLKLVAQVQRAEQLEPLPDVDFNIRAGNTLVGFATLAEVQESLRDQLNFKPQMVERILADAQKVDEAFQVFRRLQTTYGKEALDFSEAKAGLRRLDPLREQLDRYLAEEYEVDPEDAVKFAAWAGSHKSFHWFAEFFGILHEGGFDVIIGNPPYVEYGKIRRQYQVRGYRTESCGNLYAMAWERSLRLGMPLGRIGMIVPVAAVCTDDYSPLQRLLRESGTSIVSNFNDRPSKLFDGLEHIRLCIVLHEKGCGERRTFSTAYIKWRAVERPFLFQRLAFVETSELNREGAMAKIGTPLETSLLGRLRRVEPSLGDYATRAGKAAIYYTRKLSHFVQVLNFVPEIQDAGGRKREPSELKTLRFDQKVERDVLLAALNSSLFYWLLTVYSDCRNLNKREVEGLRIDLGTMSHDTVQHLQQLCRGLMEDIERNSRVTPMKYKNLGTLLIQYIFPRLSKPIIDEIDRILARHYGFTDEELEFILNYDIKYRRGQDSDTGEQEE